MKDPTKGELTKRAKDLLVLSQADNPDIQQIEQEWRDLDADMDDQVLDICDLDLTEKEMEELDALAYAVETGQVHAISSTEENRMGLEECDEDLPEATPLPPPPTREEMAAAARAKKARKQAIY